MIIRRKYPVTYKGETYEVRWESLSAIDCDDVNIYKVTKHRFLPFKKYKYQFGITHNFLRNKLIETLSFDLPYFYIKEVKLLFSEWEKHKEKTEKKTTIAQNKESALFQWDGII